MVKKIVLIIHKYVFSEATIFKVVITTHKVIIMNII